MRYVIAILVFLIVLLIPAPTADAAPSPSTIITDENGVIWYFYPRPINEKLPQLHGDWYTIIENYGIPLGLDAVINHVGDCFD